MHPMIRLEFNCSDVSMFQVVQLCRQERRYFVSFQPFDGDRAGRLEQKEVPAPECEALLKELEDLRVPIGRREPGILLGGFHDLAINLSMNSCHFRWGATPPGWEPLAGFATRFAEFVSLQFGTIYFS